MTTPLQDEVRKEFREKSKHWDIASSVRPGIDEFLDQTVSLIEARTLERVHRAWNEPGVNPEYHFMMKAKLRKEWPVLARAIEVSLQPEGETN